MPAESKYWQRYQPTADMPWNVQRVVHLHRRAGFAATWTELQRDLAGNPQDAVEKLLRGQTRTQGQPAGFDATAKLLADTAVTSQLDRRLKAAWVYRFLYGPDPLGERLALLWHNHFATSNRKIKNLALMQGQNDLFRQYCRAPFVQLLSTVVHQGAMLEWLDADKNTSGNPNENLGRELLELFTLGVGNYTEADVQEAARALTGWRVIAEQFRFDSKIHDNRPKTILSQTGNFDGDKLLQLLTEQPATAHRLAWRITHMLMSKSAVPSGAIDELAAGLREHDLNIGWSVETVLRSRAFFERENLSNRINSPPEYIVGIVRALECFNRNPSTLLLADWMARMGQDLFYPPNVGGWGDGPAWLGSGAIVARANFAAALVAGRLTPDQSVPDLVGLIERHIGRSNLKRSTQWLAELLFGGLPDEVIASIEKEALRQRDNSVNPLDAALLMLLSRPEAHLS